MRYHEFIERPSRKPLAPTGTIKPMTPEQSRKEALRKAEIDDDIRDQKSACAIEVNALRRKLSSRP
jgi:hypothetical protein